jgi:UTP:GlnB (protein PII) uridylyltransferase
MARSGWLEVFIPALQAARERMLDKAEYPVLHVRHALDVVRWLDTLLGQFGSVDKGHPYSNLTQQFVQQPDILYLAALLHDVGHIGADAGSSSAHQQRGAEAARKIAKGFGYSDDETYKLAWLVANHHELRRIARLASINDETLGRRVEEAVIGPDSLTMLYALTAADLMSNPRQRTDEAMHSWVARAYKAGSARMSPSDVQHDQENLKHRIAQEYGAQLKYSGSAAMADVENHLQRLPPAYLSELSPEEIVQHLIGISRGAYPYIHWINEETDETDDPTKKRLQRVVVVAHDQAGLLSRMCAGLSFPIVEARVYTRSDGFACNVITCAVPHSWLTSDLVRKSQELRNSLCAESLPSLRFVDHYTAILNREGRQPEQVRYEVLQQILSDIGARLTVKGPDRKHLASLIADIFPGIVTARFASGPPGEVNDSFIVPTPIPKRLLTQLVQRLNREAGILPQESL